MPLTQQHKQNNATNSTTQIKLHSSIKNGNSNNNNNRSNKILRTSSFIFALRTQQQQQHFSLEHLISNDDFKQRTSLWGITNHFSVHVKTSNALFCFVLLLASLSLPIFPMAISGRKLLLMVVRFFCSVETIDNKNRPCTGTA